MLVNQNKQGSKQAQKRWSYYLFITVYCVYNKHTGCPKKKIQRITFLSKNAQSPNCMKSYRPNASNRHIKSIFFHLIHRAKWEVGCPFGSSFSPKLFFQILNAYWIVADNSHFLSKKYNHFCFSECFRAKREVSIFTSHSALI